MPQENFSSQNQAKTEGAPVPHCNFDILVICGPSGVGKTTIANSLAKELHLPPSLKMGNHLRHRVERRQLKEVLGPMQREDVEDVRTDVLLGYVIERHMRNPKTPIIIEARRAALVASLEEEKAKKEGKQIPRVVKVFLTAQPSIRYGRIHKRQPKNSIKEVANQTQQREEYDLKKWRRISKSYPDMLYEINPFDSNAIEYDITVDTDNKNIQQVFEEIMKGLYQQNFLIKPIDEK